MPAVQSGEKSEHYVHRCMAENDHPELDQKARLGRCFGMFRDHYGQKKPEAKKADDSIGPYRAQSAADVAAQDQIIGALTRNREEHTGHYLLNPYVGGPLTELAHRMGRRIAAARATSPTMSAMSALPGLNPLSLVGVPSALIAGGGDRQSAAREMYRMLGMHDRAKQLGDKDREKADPKKMEDHLAVNHDSAFKPTGPFATENAAHLLASDAVRAGVAHAKEHSPKRYWLDPTINGPLSGLMQELHGRDAATLATTPSMAVAHGATTLIPDVTVDNVHLPIGAAAQRGTMAAGMLMGGPTKRTQARERYEASGAGKYRDEEAEKDKQRTKKEGSAMSHFFSLLARDMAARGLKMAVDLSPGTEARKELPKSDFARPAETPKGTTHKETHGAYPIPDQAHARAAEGFCAMHHGAGSAECQAVKAKVHAKFGQDVKAEKEWYRLLGYKEAAAPRLPDQPQLDRGVARGAGGQLNDAAQMMRPGMAHGMPLPPESPMPVSPGCPA